MQSVLKTAMSLCKDKTYSDYEPDQWFDGIALSLTNCQTVENFKYNIEYSFWGW